MHLGVLTEFLVIIALIAGVTLLVAFTVAMIAATPTTAVAVLKTWKTDETAFNVINLAFSSFAWIMLPSLLVRYATEGVGETMYRFTIAARFLAAVSFSRLASQSEKGSGST